MPLHVPSVAIVPIRVHTFEIDGTFDDDESIIGGAVTINGLILWYRQKDTQGDDVGGNASLFINNTECPGSTLYANAVMGLMGAYFNGTTPSGLLYDISEQEIQIPHTSFDVKNTQGATKYFHRTVEVLVLNRS